MTQNLTQGEILTQIIFWGSILVIYILRNTFMLCGILWYFIRIFLVTLLVMLFANYAKDSIKKWWDE